MQLAVMLNKGKQLLFVELVNFVQQQEHRPAGFLYQLENLLVTRAEFLSGIHDLQDEMTTFQGIIDLAHHLAV